MSLTATPSLAALAASALRAVPAPSAAGEVVVEASRTDERDYRHLVLANGLRVLVVSDPTSDMAAAALEVSVGSFSDSVEGLAHFCEHMCFLGTASFPDENSFSSFLNDRGGSSNAYTACEATNYQFDVAAAEGSLEQALERFASFFACPLFTESATGRELDAVDSEHAKNLQSDMWRSYQLDKSTSDPAHPYSRFGTGDSRTLRDEPVTAGIDVRQELLKFHDAHYSASRMTLAILGCEPVATLAAWAERHFAAIKSNGSSPPVFASGAHPHATRSGLLQRCVPVKDLRSLTISWALPEQKSGWRSKSPSYLSHLLGHEGRGSVLSLLKAHGLAEGLHAGLGQDESTFSTFAVTVELSEAGLARVDDVQAVVYAYVGMLAAHGPQRWVFDELAVQSAATFRFLSKHHPVDTVTSIASGLADYADSPSQVLSGDYLYLDFAPLQVDAIMALFTPANSRVRISAKALEPQCTLVERVYKTKYGEEVIAPAAQQQLLAVVAASRALTESRIVALGGKPVTGAGAGGKEAAVLRPLAEVGAVAFVAELVPQLTLPAPNDFLATDFDIRDPSLAARKAAEEAARATGNSVAMAASAAAAKEALSTTLIGGVRVRREPQLALLRRDARHELHYHLDDFFAVPKLQVNASVRFPATASSSRGSALGDLYARLLEEALSEYAYAAEVAGLRFSVATNSGGVQLAFSGFAHKMHTLVAKVADKAARLTFDDVLFGVQRDRLARAYANVKKDQPCNHAVSRTTLASCAPCFSVEEKAAALVGVDAETMRAFLPELLRLSFVRLLVSGNASRDEALAVADALLAPLAAVSAPVPAALMTSPRALQLPAPLRASPSCLIAVELVYALPARNASDPNAAMCQLLQVGPAARGPACKQNAMVELAAHLLSEPFFDVLRTQQQLGYIVQAGSTCIFGVDSLRFLVQSSKVPAAELVRRTDAFLGAFAASIASMPSDKFVANVRAVAVRRSEADKNLSAESDRLWTEVRTCALDFSRASHEVRALQTLTQAEVARWFEEHVAPGGSQRRALTALVEGGTAGSAADGKGAGEGSAEAAGGDAAGEDSNEEEEEEVGKEEVEAEGAGAGAAPAVAAAASSSAAPLVAVAPVPTLDATFAQASALVLHVATAGGDGGQQPAVVAAAFAAAGLGAQLQALLAETATAGLGAARLRVTLPRDDDAPALLRALLPTFPDLQNSFAAANAAAWAPDS